MKIVFVEIESRYYCIAVLNGCLSMVVRRVTSQRISHQVPYSSSEK